MSSVEADFPELTEGSRLGNENGAVRRGARRRRVRALPGFPLALGYTTLYLSLLVLLPLGVLLLDAARLTWSQFWRTVADPIVVAAYELTFGATFAATTVNSVAGLLVAWVLVRYRFPGRRICDAIVDFPFALPTAVAGLTFSNLYLPTGWIGALGKNLTASINSAAAAAGIAARLPDRALDWLRFPYSNTNIGVAIVLIFVGLPFVVRSVQPVLQDWDSEYDLAALSLGATRWTLFRRVIFPEIFPAWLSGVGLAFARAVGEYGSVIFIAGNIPGKSEIAPLAIVMRLNDFKYPQATAIGAVLLLSSLAVLLLFNCFDWWVRRRVRTEAVQ